MRIKNSRSRSTAGAVALMSLLGLGSLGGCDAAATDESAAQAAALNEPGGEADEAAAFRGDEAARQRRIAKLKSQIRAISLANQTRTDNLPAVAAQLRPLVNRLVAIAPTQTAAERFDLLIGPWYNLWSNLGYGGFTPDLKRIFQVVTRNGHYYNLSQSPTPIPLIGNAVSALRGAYAPIPEGFAIRFTRNGFFGGTLVGRTGADLVKLAADIESGARPIIPLPGPIGITGRLTTIYVDQDLRIVGGDQTPVFDDNGKVTVPGQYDLLFVLDRQVGPVQ